MSSEDGWFKKGQTPWNKGMAGYGKGHTVSKEARNKISKATLGQHRFPRTEFKKGHILSPEALAKMARSLTGKKPPRTAFKKGHNLGMMPKNHQRPGKFSNVVRGWFDINGKRMFFRSKWEVNYALYLDWLIKQKIIIKWEYEPETFIFHKIQSGTRSYRPDFRVTFPDGTIQYHEIKGWDKPRSKTQRKRMKKYYPEIKLVLINTPYYNDLVKKIGKIVGFIT